MNNIKRFLVIAAFCLSSLDASAQKVRMHSHNDYFRTAPFYEAYSQKAESIECDMYLVGNTFLVGHDRDKLTPERTFEELYLEPIIRVFRLNGGCAWKDEPERPIQLMIDVKSADKQAFMKALVKRLRRHRDVFDPSVNPHACKVVITGYFPHEEGCGAYPDYIFYDYGRTEDELTQEQLSHVLMFSPCFRTFSKWDGKTPNPDLSAICEQIARAHALGKPIRFWAVPDTRLAWETLRALGVDFTNTDSPARCAVWAAGL